MSAQRQLENRRTPAPEIAGGLHLHVHRLAEGAAVIEVNGEVDLYTAPRLAEIAEARIRSTIGMVIIDLGPTTFLAVSGLRTLHHLQLLARVHQVEFYVDPGESRPVRRLLEILPLPCARPGMVASLGLSRLPSPRGTGN